MALKIEIEMIPVDLGDEGKGKIVADFVDSKAEQIISASARSIGEASALSMAVFGGHSTIHLSVHVLIGSFVNVIALLDAVGADREYVIRRLTDVMRSGSKSKADSFDAANDIADHIARRNPAN